MKKILFAFLISFSATITAFAEDMSSEVEALPIDNTIVFVSAVILMLGVLGVSAINNYSYKKENLRKVLSQLNSAPQYNTQKQSYQRGNYQRVKVPGGTNPYRGSTYYNPNNAFNQSRQVHDQMMQQQMHDQMMQQQMQQQMHDQMMQQQMNDQFNQQMMQQTMDESWKSVTPFDHGGYVQGDGFNPSDTMASQMNDMNNMNMGMF